MANAYSYLETDSPLGPLTLVGNEDGLMGIYFAAQRHFPEQSPQWERNDQHSLLQRAAQQLQEYFAGKRQVFDIPLIFKGTDFQCEVWAAMRSIPYGHTTSYQSIANAIGKPKAIRAVGTAIGRNPFTIMIPCHRVIGTDGKLHGYAGGLDKKQALLSLETH